LVSVDYLSDPVPYLRIDGYITPEDVSVPVKDKHKIQFMAALPDKFNGRYFMFSKGGTGNYLPDPPEQQLIDGFAVGTCRKSYAIGLFDFDFLKEPDEKENYLYRAVHLTAVATQQLTREYYDIEKIYRYISGCSGGGNSGLMNAITYGTEDFDGVIRGASPIVNVWHKNEMRILQYISEKPSRWISPELLAAAEAEIIEAYDAVDGMLDGLIWDDTKIDFDEQLLSDVGFTQDQIDAFNFIRTGWDSLVHFEPVTGEPAHVPGFSISRITHWTSYQFGEAPPPWTAGMVDVPISFTLCDSMMRAEFGEDYNFLTDFDINDPEDELMIDEALVGGTGDSFSDWSEFRDSGGKFLYYHGADDPADPPGDIIMHYEFLSQREATPDDLNSWARFFLVPGLDHCDGGPGPQDVPDRVLDALILWVEQGKAPEYIVTIKDVNKIFLLLPYQPE
jgi:feruloyl esterase